MKLQDNILMMKSNQSSDHCHKELENNERAVHQYYHSLNTKFKKNWGLQKCIKLEYLKHKISEFYIYIKHIYKYIYKIHMYI